MTQTAHFSQFSIELRDEAVIDCSRPGNADEAVAYWAVMTTRNDDVTPERLAAELKDHGAWSDDELADDWGNWKRIIWIAAGNLHG